jgi:hypothetical protein
VKQYIRENGGTTSAGEIKLGERWRQLNGQQVRRSTRKATPTAARAHRNQASNQNASASQAVYNTPYAPIVTFAPFPITTGQSPAALFSHISDPAGEEYDCLTERQKRDVVDDDWEEQLRDGREEPDEAEADDRMEWGYYEPLSLDEMRVVLGPGWVPRCQ